MSGFPIISLPKLSFLSSSRKSWIGKFNGKPCRGARVQMKRGRKQKKKETRKEVKGSISSQKRVGGGKSDMEAGEGNWKGKG